MIYKSAKYSKHSEIRNHKSMNISELSIRRPVLATVLTIIILLFGFIGYNYLGVREYRR